MEKENGNICMSNSDSANNQDSVTSETDVNNSMTSAEKNVTSPQEIMSSNSAVTQDMTSSREETLHDLTASKHDGLHMLPSSDNRDLVKDNIMLPALEKLSNLEKLQEDNLIPHCSDTGSTSRAFQSPFNNDLNNDVADNKKLTENCSESVTNFSSGQCTVQKSCGDLTKTALDSTNQSFSINNTCDSSVSQHTSAFNSNSKEGKMGLGSCEVLKSRTVDQEIQLKCDSDSLIGPVIRISDTTTNVDTSEMFGARNSESIPNKNIDLSGSVIELLDDDIIESASNTNLINDQLVNKATQNDAMASQSLQSISTIISNVSESSSLVESDVCIIDPPEVGAKTVKSHEGSANRDSMDQVAGTSLISSHSAKSDDTKLDGSRNSGQNSFSLHSESSRKETMVSDSSMFLSSGRNKADTDIKRVPGPNSTVASISHETKNPSQIDMYQNSSKNRPSGSADHTRISHHNLSSAVRMPQFDLMSQRCQTSPGSMLLSGSKKTKEYSVSDYRPADPQGIFGNRAISAAGSQVNRTSSMIGSQIRTNPLIGSQESRMPSSSMRLPGDNRGRGGARQNVSGRGRGEGGRRMRTGFRMTTPAPNLANSRTPSLGRGAMPMPPLSVINQAAIFAPDSVHQAFGLPFPNRGSTDALYLGSRILPGSLATASSTPSDQPLDLTSRSVTDTASDCQATDLRVNVTRNAVSEDPDCPLDLTIKKRKLNDGSPSSSTTDSKSYQFSSNRSAFVPNRSKNTTNIPQMSNTRQLQSDQQLTQRGAFGPVPSHGGAKFRASTPYASPLIGNPLSSLPGKMGPIVDPASPYCRSAYANQLVRHNRGDFGGGILGADQAIRPAHQSGKFGSVLSEGPGHPIAVPVITHSATAMAQQAHNNPTSTMSDTMNSSNSQYTSKGLKDFRLDSRLYPQPLSPSKQAPLPPAHSYKSSFNPLAQQRLSSGGYAKEGTHPQSIGHSTVQMNNLCTGFTFSGGSVIDCSTLPSPSIHNPIHLPGHDPSLPSGMIDASVTTGQNLTGLSDDLSRSLVGGFGPSTSDQLGGWLPAPEGSYIDLTESSPTEGPSGVNDDCEPDVGQMYPARTESVLSEMLTSHTSVYTGATRQAGNARHHEPDRTGLNSLNSSAFGISPGFGISSSHLAGISSSSMVNDRFNQSISSSKSINEGVGGEGSVGGKMEEVGSRFILESDLRARRLSGQRSRVIPVANVQPIMKNQSTVVSESTSTNSASQSGGSESTEQPGASSCADSKQDTELTTSKSIESPGPAGKVSATVGLAISSTGFGAAGGLGASSFHKSKSGHSLHQSKSHHMEFLKFLHQKSASTTTSPNPMVAEAVNSRKRKRLTLEAQDEGTDVKQNPYRTPPEKEDESTGSDGSNSNQLQKDQVESVKRQLLMIKTDSSIDAATSAGEVELDNGLQNRSLEAVYDAKGAIVGSAIISTCDSTRKHSNIEYIDDNSDDINDDNNDGSGQKMSLLIRNDDPSMNSGKKKQKKSKYSPDGAILQQISSSSGDNFSYTTFQMGAKKAAGFGVPPGFKRGGKAGRGRGGLKTSMLGSGLSIPGEQSQGHCSTQGQGHYAEGQIINDVSVDQSGQILGQGQEIGTFQRKFSVRGKRGRGKLSGMGRGRSKHTGTHLSDVMIDAESSQSVDHIDHMDYTDSGFSSLTSSALSDESSTTGPSTTKLSPLGSGRGKIFHKSGQYKGKEKAKMSDKHQKWREEDIKCEGVGGATEVAGESALHKATRLGYEDLVWYYLTSGDIHANVQDNLGQTPLHISCARSGLIQITRILLHHGAHPNSKSTDGTRPLHVAISNNDLKTVRLLISYGADVTLINDSKRSVVRLAKHRDMKNFLNAVLSDMTGGEEGVECPWEFNPFVKSTTSASASGLDILTDVPSDDESDAMVGNFDQTDREQDLLTAHHLRLDSKKGPRNYHYVADVLASSGSTVTIEDFTLLNDNLTHISIGRDTLQETLSLHGGSTMDSGSTVQSEPTPLCDEASDFVLGLSVKELKPKTWCKSEVKSSKKGVVYEPVPEDVGPVSEACPEDDLPQRVLRVNSVKGKDNRKKTLEKARLAKFKTMPLQSNEALGSAIKEEQKDLSDVFKSEESEFTDEEETKPKPATPSPHKSTVIGKRLSQNKTPAAVGGLGCDIKPGSLFQGEVMFVQLDDALRNYLELSTTKRTLTTDVRGASRCKIEHTDSSQNFFIDDKTKTEEYTVDIKDTPTKMLFSLKSVSTKLKWLPSETGGSLVIAKDCIGLSNKKKISVKDKYSLKQEIPTDLHPNPDQQLPDQGEVTNSNETNVNPGESSSGVSTKIVLQRNPTAKLPGRPLGSKSFHYKFKTALKRGASLVRLDAASHIQTRSRKLPSESISAPCSDNDSPEATSTEEKSPSKFQSQSSLNDWRVSHPCKVVLSQIDSGSTSTGGVAKWSVARFSSGEKRRLRTGRKITTSLLYNRSSSADDLSGKVDDAGTTSSTSTPIILSIPKFSTRSTGGKGGKGKKQGVKVSDCDVPGSSPSSAGEIPDISGPTDGGVGADDNCGKSVSGDEVNESAKPELSKTALENSISKASTSASPSKSCTRINLRSSQLLDKPIEDPCRTPVQDELPQVSSRASRSGEKSRKSSLGDGKSIPSGGSKSLTDVKITPEESTTQNTVVESTSGSDTVVQITGEISTGSTDSIASGSNGSTPETNLPVLEKHENRKLCAGNQLAKLPTPQLSVKTQRSGSIEDEDPEMPELTLSV